MIPLYSSLEISSIEVFSDATPTRKNGRGNYSSVNNFARDRWTLPVCLEENEKGVKK